MPEQQQGRRGTDGDMESRCVNDMFGYGRAWQGTAGQGRAEHERGGVGMSSLGV